MRMQAWCRSPWPRKIELLEMFLQKVPFLLSMLLWRNAWPTQGTCSNQLIHLHHEIVAASGFFVNIKQIVVETKEERLAAGKPVGHDVPYIAMGGITGFSSLIEGSQRLDPSGVGDSIGNMYRALEWPNRSELSKGAQKTLFLYFINYSFFIFL